MDTLRGSWDFGSDGFASSQDGASSDPTDFERIEREPPPRPVGQDERRMQVRAYNHWAGLLDDRNFPSIAELNIERLDDFGPYSVLLEFTDGIEDPQIRFLGKELREECCLDENATKLSDVPARSVLSRITDHYLQILGNQAPIGFEAEFVNQADREVLYRGILLPYSSDDKNIDFVLGVINWKELAGADQAAELLLEIDQALAEPSISVSPTETDMMDDWADGPAAELEGDPQSDDDVLELGVADGTSVFSGDYAADFGDEYGGDDELEEDSIPGPSFGSLTGGGFTKSLQGESGTNEPLNLTQKTEDSDLPSTDLPMPQEYVAPEAKPHFDLLSDEPEVGDPEATSDAEGEDAVATVDQPPEFEAHEAGHESGSDNETDSEQTETHQPVAEETAPPANVEEKVTLYDTLGLARESAHDAKICEDRSRKALYSAISQAYDFALASENAPLEYAEILEDCGLTTQDRAPMTPIAKLVFGMDYDKTRLTEYAAALAYAKRQELEPGELGDYISEFEGGLKGIVAAERKLRREKAGKPAKPSIMQRLAKKLRAIAPIAFDNLNSEGEEFAIVMIRRNADGGVELLGEVPSDPALISKAAKKLVS